MRVLALDTASPAPALALLTGDGDSPRVEPLPANAAEALAGRVRAAARGAGTDLKGLDRVAVLAGPGSFTGLRAGLAFGRGLARALGAAFLAVPTFTVAAEAAPPGDLDLLLGAGRGEVHVARRRARAGRAALEVLPAPVPREAALAAAAADRAAVLDLDRERHPLAATLARLAASPRGENAAGTGPVYGRRSAAEEKWDR